MKKLLPKRKKFLDNRSRKKTRLRKKHIKFRNTVKRLNLKKSLAKYKINYRKRRIELTAPTVLNLSDNYEEVTDFFHLLRYFAQDRFKSLKLDFTKIEKISPICALILTSEVDKWQTFKGRLKCQDTDEWNTDIKQRLQEMGFLDLINPANPYVVDIPPTDIGYIKFKTGTKNEGRLADELAKSLATIAGAINSEHLLYSGLTEAMQNTIDWAYPDDLNVPENLKKWWMTAYYNKYEKSATVMVYDHGVGIPKTLPKSDFWEICKLFLSRLGATKYNDAQLIKAAMNIGKTASMQSNRGKGLKNIQSFIKASPRGVLRIFSGKGEYTMDSNGVENIILHDRSINGTLVAWQIHLGSE